MRRTIALSGTWGFQLDPDGTLGVDTLAPDREITVPLPWQAAFPELQEYSGYAWYRRTFDLERDRLEGEALLRFGAVDYWCQVFVNGALAGEHEGGYTEFTLPVAAMLREGRNEVAVRVFDAAQSAITIPRWRRYDNGAAADGPPFDPEDVPHGKQEWYVNVGGIWQDVTLTAVPRTYLSLVHVTPNIATGEAAVRFEVAGAGAESVHVAISDGDTTVEQTVARGQTEAVVRVENARLWSLEDPHLYTATVTVRGAVGAEDSLSVRFGFREVSTRDGKLLLNGEPIYLLSALDQDMYADTIYTVPSEEYLRDQFAKAKALGLNNLRCHIKPPDPLYLDLADEMGLLVWAEIPSWRTFYIKGTMHEQQLHLGEPIRRRVERTLEEMVRRDFNHPSLVIWTIVNEDWGTTLPLSALDREWVLGMYDRCKALDPTRLVVDNSACPHPWGPNIHVKSDLDDFHVYANIPDQARKFEHTIEEFGLRPLWTYSGHGDSVRTGHEPLVLSEFGNWGLPSARKLREPHGGADPAWFTLGPWWNSWEGEGGWPAGAEERFRRLGLDDIWGDYERFAEATQWHQFHALKYEIEAMRRQPGIAGYVITELSDIYWESNGLLDFDRNPKVFHDVFSQINTPDVVVPRAAAYAFWDDERARARVHAAHYGQADWSGARLRWSVGDGERGEAEMPQVPRGTVAALGFAAWKLPAVERAAEVQVQLAVQGDGGNELARNTLDLLVVPAAHRVAAYTDPVAVVTRGAAQQDGSITPLDRPPEGLDSVVQDDLSGQDRGGDAAGQMSLQGTLRGMGYHTVSHVAPGTRVAVASRATDDLLKWVRAGGRLLYMGDSPSPFFWVQNRGGAYSGSWLTSFSWLRPGIHRRLPVSNPLGMPFMRVMPTSTILGLPVDDRAVQADFLSGMVSGWVGHPAVHTVRFRYGKGVVLMTTFRLAGWLGTDPVATAMFHDLLDHLASDECDPTLRANY
ncbi:MAG TPA: glycoside hydrolase family 2 TIM barrel-domain containing protein [Chloroflexia bacterium]|nr:glycoside hydrolase family 2 TIM barrel-domain containing protein [Chloroflexia bacterium]